MRRTWALLSLAPILIGLAAMMGFAEVVQIFPHTLPLPFNTAFCFVLSGIALALYLSPSLITTRLQMILGFIILLFSGLSLSQDLFGFDWHIDQLGAKFFAANNQINLERMASSSALAFVLNGLIYILFPFGENKLSGIFIEIFIFFIFLIGVIGISGYLLKIEFLYGWYSYTRMAFTSATCFVILSFSLWGIWRSNPVSADLYKEKEDTKIMLLSSVILISIALAVSLACFVSLIDQQRDAVGASLKRLWQEKALLFQNEVTSAIQEMRDTRPSQFTISNENLSNPSFQPGLDAYLAKGFSAVSILNAKGEKISTLGNFIVEPELSVNTTISGEIANIMWKNGWYVKITSLLEPQNKNKGWLVVEKPLDEVNKTFARNQFFSKTNDFIVCMPKENINATCYSSRLNAIYETPTHVGNNYLPIYYAFINKTGLMLSTDANHEGVLAAFGPIEATGLSLVIKMNIVELYQGITQNLHIILSVIIISILLGLLLLRSHVVPLIRRALHAEKESQRGHQRLQESEERYALAAKANQSGLWDWVVGSEKIYSSPYFKSMLGYHEGSTELDKVDFLRERVHPDDKDNMMSLIDQHRETGVPFDIEFRMRRKYGDYHWFHAVAQSVRNESGEAVRMAGMTTDITERKRGEQRLAAQYAVAQVLSETHNFEETFVKIIQTICEHLEWDFGVAWIVDYQAGLMRCVCLWYAPSLPAQSLAIMIRNTEYFIGVGLPGRVWRAAQPVWVFDVIADKNFTCAPQALEAGLHSAFCFPILLQNKVFGAIEFFSRERQSPDEALLKMMAAIGKQIGQYVQRKFAESALIESEGYKTAILESASDSIMTINEQGSILSFNPQAVEMFGFMAAELQNTNIDTLLPELSKRLKNFSTKLVVEFLGMRKNGDTIPTEVTIAKMDLGKRNVFVCIIRNISRRKKMESQKNEFVSMVSHELKAPLISIHGALELILNDTSGDVSDKVKNILTVADHSSERLLFLINDILDIDKIESGNMDFQNHPTDVTALVTNAILENKMYGNKFGVSLKLTSSVNQILVNVDPRRVTQVLTNLISNAVKVSVRGGEVTISIAERGNMVRVSVSDKGPGIPEDFKTNIFQKFSQLNYTSTQGQIGTGLGLSISKAMIEKMGGTLHFTSKEHEGTVFYFELPIWH